MNKHQPLVTISWIWTNIHFSSVQNSLKQFLQNIFLAVCIQKWLVCGLTDILLVAWEICDGARNFYWLHRSQGCCRTASRYLFHKVWHCFGDCTGNWGTAEIENVHHNEHSGLWAPTYVLDNFQRPDVGKLSWDQLPQSSLLTFESLTETSTFFHDVSPIILETV